MIFFIKVVVVLVFYGPSTLFRSFQVLSVNLPTLFQGASLGSLPVCSAYSFASNWLWPFLNQWKGENGHKNYITTNVARCEDQTPDRPPDRRTYIQPSYHTRVFIKVNATIEPFDPYTIQEQFTFQMGTYDTAVLSLLVHATRKIIKIQTHSFIKWFPNMYTPFARCPLG